MVIAVLKLPEIADVHALQLKDFSAQPVVAQDNGSSHLVYWFALGSSEIRDQVRSVDLVIFYLGGRGNDSIWIW